MITPDELLGMQARAQRWAGMNSGTKYRSRGGTDLMRKIVTDDMPKLIEHVAALQVQEAAVEALANNYEVRARHWPKPLAQWADIEMDLRRILDQGGKRNGATDQVHG